ncbi:MAG: hypothetical protein ABSB09_15660 [Acidimicrobiales bacterium]|jgi:hypothetical protein
MDDHDGDGLTSMCESGHHDRCGHVMGELLLMSLMAGNLEGFDAADEALCGCTCHAGCPLTGQADGHGWPDRCTCVGTVSVRWMAERRRPPSDFATIFRQSRDRARLRRSARDAVQVRAAGRTRDEVSRLIDEEWTSRGLDPPAEPVRGMELDRIMDPSDRRVKDALTAADVAATLVKGSFRLARLIRQHSQPSAPDVESRPVATDERTYTIRAGKEGVAVVLDAGAQSVLADFGAEGLVAPKVMRMSDVEVREGGDGAIEVWPAPGGHDSATGDDGRRRLGVVRDEDAGPYRRPVRAAGRVHQAALCAAIRTASADGSWQLHLCVPIRS